MKISFGISPSAIIIITQYYVHFVKKLAKQLTKFKTFSACFILILHKKQDFTGASITISNIAPTNYSL